MSDISKLVLITFLFSLLSAPHASSARPNAKAPSALSLSLISRLKLEQESSNCWDSLIQLQACSSELILFFLNGETYIGDGCCEAIRTIGKQCWPNMLGTLGFSTEEGDVLQGYCDGEIEEGSNGYDKVVPAKKSLAP